MIEIHMEAATDEELRHPNKPKWIKQRERSFNLRLSEIHPDMPQIELSKMSQGNLVELENALISMLNDTLRVQALRGIVG